MVENKSTLFEWNESKNAWMLILIPGFHITGYVSFDNAYGYEVTIGYVESDIHSTFKYPDARRMAGVVQSTERTIAELLSILADDAESLQIAWEAHGKPKGGIGNMHKPGHA